MPGLADSALFTPCTMGNGSPVSLKHRICLAPLTRNRGSEPNLCAHQDHVDYYTQRASPGGLVITEAVNICPQAVGYVSVPGIWTDEQADSWRRVTDSVHAKGGKIFMQLWHVGRVAMPSFGEHPLIARSGMPLPGVSSSPTTMVHPKTGQPLTNMTYKGKETYEPPRQLSVEDIKVLVEAYRHACRQCMKANFDGVEVHAAHGYLIDQFLRNGVNKRTDAYGGTLENRCRLLYEVMEATTSVMGPGRVGVRISPSNMDKKSGRETASYFGATTSDPEEIYPYAVEGLNKFPLAYVLLTEPRWNPAAGDPDADAGFKMPLSNVGPDAPHDYRKIYKGTLMGAGGFTPQSAAEAVQKGLYDLVAFGRWFISNPDLPDRIAKGSPLNVYNRATFYTETIRGGNFEGYTDYPDLAGSVGVQGKYKTMDQDKMGSNLANAKL